MPDPHADPLPRFLMTVLRRRDPAQRMARYHHLILQGVLALGSSAESPSACDLVREWGRIGSPGATRIDGFADEAEARAAAAAYIARKQRKGYR